MATMAPLRRERARAAGRFNALEHATLASEMSVAGTLSRFRMLSLPPTTTRAPPHEPRRCTPTHSMRRPPFICNARARTHRPECSFNHTSAVGQNTGDYTTVGSGPRDTRSTRKHRHGQQIARMVAMVHSIRSEGLPLCHRFTLEYTRIAQCEAIAQFDHRRRRALQVAVHNTFIQNVGAESRTPLVCDSHPQTLGQQAHLGIVADTHDGNRCVRRTDMEVRRRIGE